MKFVISSSELYKTLQSIGKVVSTKKTLPILDCFLLNLEGNVLTITVSDLETTIVTTINDVQGEGGVIAIPSKILTDTLKEFKEQPLTFDINEDTQAIVIHSENGEFSIIGMPGNEFPQTPEIRQEGRNGFVEDPHILLEGISNTLFATSYDELRPVMAGLLMERSEQGLRFVGTDAHKLAIYTSDEGSNGDPISCLVPKKAASLLKSLLTKQEKDVAISFDNKNVSFALDNYLLVSRLVEGKYPNYAAVVPQDNNNVAVLNREKMIKAMKRVSVFSNQSSNLIILSFKGNTLKLSAQDLDFSISAYETLDVNYPGEDIEIGFKSDFLLEILGVIDTEEVVIKMSDPARASLLHPLDREESLTMLLMPMMINA